MRGPEPPIYSSKCKKRIRFKAATISISLPRAEKALVPAGGANALTSLLHYKIRCIIAKMTSLRFIHATKHIVSPSNHPKITLQCRKTTKDRIH